MSMQCKTCDGRGVLYHGWPDNPNTTYEDCEDCNGTGRKEAKHEGKTLEKQRK